MSDYVQSFLQDKKNKNNIFSGSVIMQEVY